MTQTLSQRLKEATADLHRQAERSGLMARLLRGRIDHAAYGRLLRSLLEIYQALEDAFRRHATHRLLAELPLTGLWRSDALRGDIDALRASRVAPAAPALEYAGRLAQLSRDDPALLAAHAYVRYLGDLHGGQVLRTIVGRALALHDGDGLAFYALGDAAQVRASVSALRQGFDRIGLADPAAAGRIVAEAREAFARHIVLFESLADDDASALLRETANVPVQRSGAAR